MHTIPSISYLSDLTKAADTSLLDWPGQDNAYSLAVGRITIHVWLDRAAVRWHWSITDQRDQLLYSGDSDMREVAKLEALKYAEHWVKEQRAQGILN